MSAVPVLYSFRRCPYAMRARFALAISAQHCELREVVLRDKPAQLLEASAKGTVPVLVDVDGRVIDESLDIMLWTLERNDPAGWLSPQRGGVQQMLALISRFDGDFKQQLDRYRYPDRYAGTQPHLHRAAAARYLQALNEQLDPDGYSFGAHACLADMAIAPFVRQFAIADEAYFAAQPWPAVHRWLERFVQAPLFERVMRPYEQWRPGADPVLFPSL